MSKIHEEYHPLLQDEESNICNTSPKFQRRFRCSRSGRARDQAKGATYIITRWPDHLSTLLAYWWIGLGMIALLVFIIYNSIIAIAILPPSPLKPLSILNRHFNVLNISHEHFAERNVYMHFFVNSYEELNIKDNLPYIETFSKKYTYFTFNFIVLVNDTSKHIIEDYSDELKNELALDSLWDETQHGDRQIHKKLTIQVISLSKYMDESPLKKYWRDLPRQFIGFLCRCIAIWNKGGIALNPIILTPKSPNPIYIEKLEQILDGKVNMNTTQSSKNIFIKPRKKVNNIQDIINSLENEDSIDHNDAYDVVEAENIPKKYIEKKSFKSKRNIQLSNIKKNDTILNDVNQVNKFKDLNQLNENGSHYVPANKSYYKHLYSTTGAAEGKGYDDADRQNLLPMFLKFLFHRNSNEILNNSLEGKENFTKNTPPIQKELITIPESQNVINKFSSTNITERLFPLNLIKENYFQGNFNSNVAMLTIDLNGNLISSATPCHAFIGTVFSNVFHHTHEESIKDFIITELSLFCKGTLSSCTGIDVILL